MPCSKGQNDKKTNNACQTTTLLKINNTNHAMKHFKILKGSSEAIKRRRTENPMDQRERGHQRSYREGQTTQWTSEKGVIRG